MQSNHLSKSYAYLTSIIFSLSRITSCALASSSFPFDTLFPPPHSTTRAPLIKRRLATWGHIPYIIITQKRVESWRGGPAAMGHQAIYLCLETPPHIPPASAPSVAALMMVMCAARREANPMNFSWFMCSIREVERTTKICSLCKAGVTWSRLHVFSLSISFSMRLWTLLLWVVFVLEYCYVETHLIPSPPPGVGWFGSVWGWWWGISFPLTLAKDE